VLSDPRSAALGCQAPTFAEGVLTLKAPLPACGSLPGGTFSPAAPAVPVESPVPTGPRRTSSMGDIEYGGPFYRK